MGGHIWVESSVDEGSIFSFALPFGLRANEGDQQRADSAPLNLRDMRALVVDDNANAREILVDMLKSFQMRVSEADSGEAALTALREVTDTPYELILMDWKMPGMDGIETARALQDDSSLRQIPTIVMVTAYGREEARAAAQGVDIRAFLTKPVTVSTMLDALMGAMGEQVRHRQRESQRSADLHDDVAALAGSRILLVEDNEINQELARELLSMNSIQAVIANNGQEAIDILAKQSFDGVLMDCQMPILDGYEATRRIRSDDRYKDLPIIALTANAMAGDRQKVLDAGMNDHIAKPIDPNEMLAKWIHTGHHAAVSSDLPLKPAPAPLPAIDELDMQAGLKTTQGNLELYRRLLQRFDDSQAGFVGKFEALLAIDDRDSMERAAHTLKGVAANIGAGPVREAAAALETACREGLEGEALRLKLLAVGQRLARLRHSIHAALETTRTEPVKDSPAEIADIRTQLQHLRTLLEGSDTEAMDVITQVSSTGLSNAATSSLIKLRRSIDGFDFQQALADLSELENLL